MKATNSDDYAPDLPLFRLHLLRSMYLFMFVGLALTRWPRILNPPAGISNAETVVGSVLVAISLLSLLGIRYPARMIPLLLFELLWKVIWIAGWGIPQWSDGRLTADSEQTLVSALVGVVLVPIAIPWGYVLKHYVTASGERWTKGPASLSISGPPASQPSE